MSVKLSLPVQYDDVTINPTWRTAAILKIVIYPYLSRESSECAKFWHADKNFDRGDENVIKFQEFPNSRWRTDAILKVIFWL